jgi:polyferredoxin
VHISPGTANGGIEMVSKSIRLDVDQAKKIRDTLGWWAIALFLFALLGGLFYLLTLLLTFPGAFATIIITSTVLSTAALVIYKVYIEGNITKDVEINKQVH